MLEKQAAVSRLSPFFNFYFNISLTTKLIKMKRLTFYSVVCVSSILIGTSCKKDPAGNFCNDPADSRKIQFSLYTDKNFSDNNGTITFTLSIRKLTNQILWDSILAPMKIKDIPDLSNKLVIEKAVPGNDNSILKVGFIYSIENVGISWFWDYSNAGEKFKKVDFNFQ
jgi:hypothetical protein